MARLTIWFHAENGHSAPVSDIPCKDMLDGLAKLHEQLNAVAMPRVYQEKEVYYPKATRDYVTSADLGADIKYDPWPTDEHGKRVTISC